MIAFPRVTIKLERGTRKFIILYKVNVEGKLILTQVISSSCYDALVIKH